MADLDSRRAAIASRLRTARETAGLSQGQAAKILGVHRPSVTEMESGRRKVSAEELTELARIYGVKVSWLACEDVETPDPDRDRIELAARELSKMKPEDRKRLIELLVALQTEGDTQT